MDVLMEFLGEVLLEAPFEAAMGSKKVKTSVKTALFSIFGGAIVLLFGLISYSLLCDGAFWRFAVMSALTAGMLALVIWGAVRGHWSKWKSGI